MHATFKYIHFISHLCTKFQVKQFKDVAHVFLCSRSRHHSMKTAKKKKKKALSSKHSKPHWTDLKSF